LSHTKHKHAERARSPSTMVYEKLVLSHMHACRMYLEVAAVTEQEECRARNLKSAERVRENLRALSKQPPVPTPARRILIHRELARLDARYAALSADTLAHALSLMYPTTGPKQTACMP
jgi:hypothetical protein